MPRLDVPIGSDGLLIDMRIWLSATDAKTLVAGGGVLTPPFSVSGLVDTGAKVTAIQRSIIAWMGIPSIGFTEASSSLLGGEVRTVPIYPVRMTFGSLADADTPRWRTIHAIGVDVVSPGASVLIGRDLLATCRFTYDGRKERFMMTY
jgi:hypothetical protein